MIRSVAIVLFIAWGVPYLLVAQDCKDVLTVDHVIRYARSLNGKIVCIKGVLRPIRDSTKTSVFIHELTSKAGADARSRKEVIGVMEGSGDAPVGADQYKPQSFKLLDLLSENVPPALDVVLRGAIMHEKGLFRKLSARLPSDSLYDPFRSLSYSVEFVLLEVVSVKEMKTR